MSAVLAIWNDCVPGLEEEFERWYLREHLFERLDLPGFRSGRRYEAVEGVPRFFACYTVDDAGVLSSQAYLDRLNHPTPATQRAMGAFRNMCRTVCEVDATHGRVVGSHLVVWRFAGDPPDRQALRSLSAALALRDGVAGTQVWVRSDRQTPVDTEEMRRRGGADATIAGALVVDCIRLADAREVADALRRSDIGRALAAAATGGPGIYALLCTCSAPTI